MPSTVPPNTPAPLQTEPERSPDSKPVQRERDPDRIEVHPEQPLGVGESKFRSEDEAQPGRVPVQSVNVAGQRRDCGVGKIAQQRRHFICLKQCVNRRQRPVCRLGQ